METEIPYGKGGKLRKKLFGMSLELDPSDLFAIQTSEETTTYSFRTTSNRVLDLSYHLKGLFAEREMFLPAKIWIRDEMNAALNYRMTYHRTRTVIFGSPGVGKSVFTFLAAICFAAYVGKPVLFVRKSSGATEPISVFWMKRTPANSVLILANRSLSYKDGVDYTCDLILENLEDESTEGKILATPANFINIIVDGPKYASNMMENGPQASDLVTSGGAPPASQENMTEHRLPLSAWDPSDHVLALEALRNATQQVSKHVLFYTGGSIRLSLSCLNQDGTLNPKNLNFKKTWMRGVANSVGSTEKVRVAYYSTILSADENSIDRLRSMFAKPVTESPSQFDTTLFLISPFVAGLLRSKLTLADSIQGLNFAKRTEIGSLYGWHFELWAHKVVEVASETQKSRNDPQLAGATSVPKITFLHSKGTGNDGVKQLESVLQYWIPATSNFANIDAAVLLPNGTLCCLQYTIGKEHGFNFISFRDMFLRQLPENLIQQVKTILVKFVVPFEVVFGKVVVPASQVHICVGALAKAHDHNHRYDGPNIRFQKSRKNEEAVADPMDVGDAIDESMTDLQHEVEDDLTGFESSIEELVDICGFDVATTSEIEERDDDFQLELDYFYDDTGECALDEWNYSGVTFETQQVDPGRTMEGALPFFTI